MEASTNNSEISFNKVEQVRIALVKEMGYRIQELKNYISSMTIPYRILNITAFILSIVCSFAITNFLLGLKVDNSNSTLNITTNIGFLFCISAIVLSVTMILKQSIFSYFELKRTDRSKDGLIIQKMIIFITSAFLLMVYAINLFYYKDIPGFKSAAFFISTLFALSLAVCALAGGYFKYQLKEYNLELMQNEYRPDFENVMKHYVRHIYSYVNSLSEGRIANVKENLLNYQFRMVVETIVGILTAPFLAYGVSNTLAMCFPEAASWIRISGIRFSPIFLVLATFLIIFAFFSFVRGFTIEKQIKASENIKFDGFRDYNYHGVKILGLDSIKTLTKEKNMVMFIACFIILIEFTMNVSYFITEIGGDIQGMFLSIVTALVPTALLIAETHLLSTTTHKITNYKELLSMLD